MSVIGKKRQETKKENMTIGDPQLLQMKIVCVEKKEENAKNIKNNTKTISMVTNQLLKTRETQQRVNGSDVTKKRSRVFSIKGSKKQKSQQ